MGEEVKKEEPQAEAKPEEEREENKEEEPKPPAAPFILSVDLHCPGCAKKVERSIMKIRGVEAVVTDMAQNQVAIKGIVNPQAVCAKIMKRTKRAAKILSPLPAAEGEPLPEVVTSQVSGLTTVELNVNMHCSACAEQLKKKILRMRGVQTATAELSTGKVTVTGTMDSNKLVDYVYKSTKKQAKIVPQPEPEKPAEEAKQAEESKQGNNNEDKEEEVKPAEVDNKKEVGESKDSEEGEEKNERNAEPDHHEVNMQRMIHYYQPLYVMERIPPPQIFSDENPNACCIS